MYLIFLVLATSVFGVFAGFATLKYACDGEKCILQSKGSEGISQSSCLMTCGKGVLWPYPTSDPIIHDVVLPISHNSVSFSIKNSVNNIRDEEIVSIAKIDFLRTINSVYPSGFNAEKNINAGKVNYKLQIVMNIAEDKRSDLTLKSDESYSLMINKFDDSDTVSAQINAETFYGARHGLATLSQFIVWDDLMLSMVIAADVTIKIDKPFFPYRGVMLDVSRHYLPLDVVKRTVRAMGYNKLNVLHLHLTDTASFPLDITNQPNMTADGAYSRYQYYSHNDMVELGVYAAAHGVMIMPEVDTPAHVGAGWNWGEDAGVGELVLCGDADGVGGEQWAADSLEPPSGQLNLANAEIYRILNDVYDALVDTMAGSSGILHLGGDEVIIGSDDAWAACYNSSSLGAPILSYIEELGLSRNDPETFYGLWQNFTKKAADLALGSFERFGSEARNGAMLHMWGGADGEDSEVTYNMVQRPDVTEVLPPERFRIQVWDESDQSISKTLIEKGYEIVLSNSDYVYLDCGNAGFTNPGGYWCQPYHEWYHIYDYINDVIVKWLLTPEDVKQIIGSETLPWAEMIDESNIDVKVWPRAAALAEPLWSGPAHSGQGWYAADPRMQHWRNTLVRRGIPAEALQPLWCQQREAHACTLNQGVPQ